jgi:hypothetical protein
MIISHAIANTRIGNSEANAHQMIYVVPYVQYFGSRLADFAAAREAIEQTSFNEPNWDGDGALAISNEVKANAVATLAMVEMTAVPAPEITPNPNGTLSFEWETETGIGQLEIGKSRFGFYVQAQSGPAIICRGNTEHLNGLFGLLVNDLIYRKSGSVGAITDLVYTSADV